MRSPRLSEILGGIGGSGSFRWTAGSRSRPISPIERRGLIIIDPPFEEDGDFTRLGRGLEAAHRKWPGGIYVLWYPVKGRRGPDALARALNHSGIGKILRIELSVGAAAGEGPLGGCGLIVVNPPWTLEGEL